MTLWAWCTLAFAALAAAEWTDQWAVRVPEGAAAADLAARELGFTNLGMIRDGFFHFKKVCNSTAPCIARHTRSLDEHAAIELHAKVEQAWQQERLVRNRRLVVTDPLWPQMWFLHQPDNQDINVMPAWNAGYTGEGVVVTVVDDGIEYTHPDLKDNYLAAASWDMNDNDPNPFPNESDPINSHGTRCCGQIAMALNNNVCGVGIAYKARIGGIRMLDGDVTDAIEGRSLSLAPQVIDVYTNSWGPNDDGATMEGPGTEAEAAFVSGVASGRHGLGSIYLFAAGNGGSNDNCNADGYANNLYTIAIGAIASDGTSPFYSEPCAATMVVTYSSGNGAQPEITTVDLHAGCTNQHSGTSAASPEAAGIVALALQANMNLTWRDIQHVMAHTAQMTDPTNSDWEINGANLHVNHLYGFGRLDASVMANTAKTWQSVGPQYKTVSPVQTVSKAIPYATSRTGSLAASMVISSATFDKLEHVQVTINADTTQRGNYIIELVSPAGTTSVLMTVRPYDYSGNGIHWTFMTVRCWDESPTGTWTLYIRNAQSRTNYGELIDWKLTLYGRKARTTCPPGTYYNAAAGCTACDAQCGITGCTGAGPANCLQCATYRDDATCVANCTQVGKYSQPDSMDCYACHPQCNGCTGPTAYDCIRCVNDTESTPNGTMCTTGCLRSEYADASGHCQSCDDQCDGGCSGPGPSKCVSCANYITGNMTCVAVCPNTTYHIAESFRCLPCDPQCKSGCLGSGPTQCLDCYNTRIVFGSAFECLAQCPPYQVPTGPQNSCECAPGTFRNPQTLQCQPCSPLCEANTTCSGPDPTQCSRCNFLQDGVECVAQCPALTYSAAVTLQSWRAAYPNVTLKSDSGCLPCDPMCASGCADAGADKCLTGPDGLCTSLQLYTTCVSECPEDSYAENGTLCVPCDAECKDGCFGPGPDTCIACEIAMLEGVCVSGCPDHTFATSVSVGSIDVSVCQHCNHECADFCVGPAEDQCHPFDSTNVTCVHFKLVSPRGGTHCVASCPLNYYPSDGECLRCSRTCADSCTGPASSQCSSCRVANYSGACVSACPTGMYATDQQQCAPCDSTCTAFGCNGPAADDCFERNCSGIVCTGSQRLSTSCSCEAKPCTPLFTYNGACVPRCPVSTYADDGVCVPCDAQCLNGCSGAGPANCTSCRIANLSGTCVAACPALTYLSSMGQCQPCDSQCQQCSGPGPSACTVCVGSRLEGRCVAACPTNAYTAGQECKSCHPLCSSCSGPLSTDCLSCARYQYQGECHRVCPPRTFAQNTTCLPCSGECLAACNGPLPSQCLGPCTHVQAIVAGTLTCVDKCSTNQYIDQSSTCQDCSADCDPQSGCIGPGTANCLICNSAGVNFTRICLLRPIQPQGPSPPPVASTMITSTTSPAATPTGSSGATHTSDHGSSSSSLAVALGVIALLTLGCAVLFILARQRGWRMPWQAKPAAASTRYKVLAHDEDEEVVFESSSFVSRA
eukprot:m.233535 g.233535  ORF g.233535 m.233535 type:complete len:1481 (-) comp12531_c0_seq1:233-4675(-)